MNADERYEKRLEIAFPNKSPYRREELAEAWSNAGIPLPDPRKGYPPEKVERYTKSSN